MINKTKLALGIAAATLTMTGVLVSPEAMAKKAKAHVITESSSSYSSSTTSHVSNAKLEAMEAQMQAMQSEIMSLRAQANRPASSAEAGKVQELDQWMESVKSAPVAKKPQDNMIFFRGGYARNDVKRNDILTGNQVANNILGAGVTNQDGYYIGAGFDFGLTDDVWGLAKNTDIMAELMFDYRSFGEKNFKNGNPLNATVTSAVNGGLATTGVVGNSNINTVSVSQFTLGASPKIKFLKGSAFRPWVIPFGLTVNVISPPSNGVTVLNPGMQFGTGAEYAIWKAIKVGADVRYNLTGRAVDGVNTNGLTAGGYLGIGF
jgi:opacity protein-like surface antigen